MRLFLEILISVMLKIEGVLEAIKKLNRKEIQNKQKIEIKSKRFSKK
jgi:hypothetical protein